MDNDKITAIYVRVSTVDQNCESQTMALVDWCSKNNVTNYQIFADHGVSGAKESRPALNRMMNRVEAGDIRQVIVFQFSRFARSTTHLLKALEKFREKKVRFHSICEAIDTESPMGLALFTILGCLSQLERELIRERVRAGLKNAKAKGIRIGRVRKRNDALIHSLLDANLTFRAIGEIAKCSHGSVSAAKKEWLALKAQAEQQKLDNLTASVEKNQVADAVESMNAQGLPPEAVAQVQAQLEQNARDHVQAVQGVAYETFD